MAEEQGGVVLVLPDKWYLMSDEEIHAWRVEHGYKPPGPYDPYRRARELGERVARRREEAVLKAFLGAGTEPTRTDPPSPQETSE